MPDQIRVGDQVVRVPPFEKRMQLRARLAKRDRPEQDQTCKTFALAIVWAGRPKDQPRDEVKRLLCAELDESLAETSSSKLGPELIELRSALQADEREPPSTN
jgi:hypothetical protein